MAKYRPIQEHVEEIMEFDGSHILHPVYQCKNCGHSISPGFAKSTGVCGMCYEGMNNIGEYIDQIYSVSIYCNDFSNHSLTNAIKEDEGEIEVKQGECAEEMAEILEWGIENFDNLQNADYLVPPPRGREDADLNHMKKIGEIVSSSVDVPLIDPLRKNESYTSQKEIEDPEDRIENVKDNIQYLTKDPRLAVSEA